MFARMLRCVSITPLGTPVLPLEKITVASSCRSAGRQKSRSRSAAGSRRAAASIDAFCAADVDCEQIFEEDHAGHRRDAGLRQKGPRGQDRRDAAALDRRAIASWPAVKFRLTGTLAGDRGPRCWRARRRPRPAAAARLRARPEPAAGSRATSSRLPTSARPKRQLAAGRVGHAERRPLPLRGADEARAERLAPTRSARIGADLICQTSDA